MKPTRHPVIVLFSICFLFQSMALQAKVRLAELFTDNMVLQQKSQASIWGQAAAGRLVTVRTSWNAKRYSVMADGKGNFKLQVQTAAAGGPYTMTFNDGTPLQLKNILLGEVWVCSGQSNMEMPLAGWGKVKDYEKEIAAANYPQIRLFQVKKATNYVPQNSLKSDGGWKICNPEHVAEFSAVAYFFAREINKKNHVPIGLIHSSWGGTIAEAWTSAGSLKTTPYFAESLKRLPKDTLASEKAVAEYKAQLEDYRAGMLKRDSGYFDGKPVWATDTTASRWKPIKVPGLWEQSVLPGFDGIVWIQRKVIIPPGWTGKALQLNLGTVDDDDVTFFNGQEIGRTEGYNKPRIYAIPAELVKTGEALITVRVTDNGGGGGFSAEPEMLNIGPVLENKTNLSGEWRFRPSVSFAKVPPPPHLPNDPNQVTVLYNAMIHPLINYGIRGVIWYQGESNADRAFQYQTLFPLLIKDWRSKWHIGSFPFLFVQLANFAKTKDEPGESTWAELREAQLKTLALPNTGMAVAIDIGEAGDIHPKNKQEVGHRLALIARAKVYGENIVYSGPVFKSLKIDGRFAHLAFLHTDSGLQTHGAAALQGFSMAGPDKKFYWASAQIKGTEVVLSCPEVPNPIAVRYAWADNPVCNLFNGKGLPATPFRTDTFTGITEGKK